ncbi:MAG TPA: hypothetical protein PK121_01950 [Candidatus Pacearchaeota archaeon]|nr:hypothetical protein [Candidatus Pacearchaeota archaeon]
MANDETQKPLLNFPPFKKQKEEIEIYHDEGYEKNNKPFAHQFLAIPVFSKELFYSLLECIRKKYDKDGVLTIKWSKIQKDTFARNQIAKEWLGLLQEATYQKKFKYYINSNLIFKGSLGIKMSTIFINSLNDLSDDFYKNIEKPEEKRRKKYESLMRMGIQGLTSFCFNPKYTNYSQVVIKRLYTDGEYGSIPIDSNKIINKLKGNSRNYVQIDTDKIEGVKKNKNKTAEVDFEELTDLVLGATRYLYSHEKRNEMKDKIVEPIREMYNKRERNKKGWEVSGHYRTFSVSRCEKENGRLIFREISIIQGEEAYGRSINQTQLNLF